MRQYLHALWLVSHALRIRFFRDPRALRLVPPAPPGGAALTPPQVEQLARLARRVSAWVFWRRHRCFYHSYVLATLLREAGIPATLNLGYRGLFGDARRRAHCWVSVNGVAVAEEEDVGASFSQCLGERDDGICYWAGAATVVSAHGVNLEGEGEQR